MRSKADYVSLIYRTEPKTKKWEKTNMNGYAQKYR